MPKVTSQARQANRFPEHDMSVDQMARFGSFKTSDMTRAKVKQIVANRKEANAYLDRIQSRINRGHKKGALALLNRWIKLNNPMRWEVMAFTDKLDTAPIRATVH